MPIPHRCYRHVVPLAVELTHAADRAVFLDSLARCGPCSQLLDQLHEYQRRMEVSEPLVGSEYEAAPRLAAELLRVRRHRRGAALDVNPLFHHWGLAVWLLEAALERMEIDPPEALHLANLGLRVALRLEPDEEDLYRPVEIADLRARACGVRATTHRVLGEHDAAERYAREAERWLAAGTGKALPRLRFLKLRAGLLLDQGRVTEARALLRQALAEEQQTLAAEGGDPDLRARLLAELEEIHERRFETVGGRRSDSASEEVPAPWTAILRGPGVPSESHRGPHGRR